MLGPLFHSRTNLYKLSRTTCPVQLFGTFQLTQVNLVSKTVWNRPIASVLSILTRLKVFYVLCHHLCSIHRNLTISIWVRFACLSGCPIQHFTFQYYLQAKQSKFPTSHIRWQVPLNISLFNDICKLNSQNFQLPILGHKYP